MLNVGPGIYSTNNYRTVNSKKAQTQPAFKAITPQKAFEIGYNLPDHRAQQLMDMATAYVKAALKNKSKVLERMRETMEWNKKDDPLFSKAIGELLAEAPLGK